MRRKGFDEIRECPHCHTNKELNANLEFLFSECCGYALCQSCTSQIFSKNATLRCPNCNETVNKKKYSKNRLSTQQFQNEASKRTQIHQACNLIESDFESKREWNDYLEFVEDLVYDLSHGTGEQRKRAEQTFKEWRAKNNAKIEKNRDRILKEQMKAQNETYYDEQEDTDGDVQMQRSQIQQNVSIHPVFSHLPGAIVIDKEIPKRTKDITEKMKKRIKRASGFTNRIADLRDKTELLSGLFEFPS